MPTERKGSTEDRFAATNGIVIPSRLPAGQLPDKGRAGKENERKIHPCIICGRKFEKRSHVKEHFGVCVERNGNPTGARWNDELDGTSSGLLRSTQIR